MLKPGLNREIPYFLSCMVGWGRGGDEALGAKTKNKNLLLLGAAKQTVGQLQQEPAQIKAVQQHAVEPRAKAAGKRGGAYSNS